jgi:hypothetical protein
LFVLAAVAHAHAQQTVTVPPPTSLPSTFPQFQTYAGCLMNCDTRAGTCQSTCSVSNSPAVTFAAPSSTPSATRSDPSLAPVRPDAGALAQCSLNCSTQALACKQACSPPH